MSVRYLSEPKYISVRGPGRCKKPQALCNSIIKKHVVKKKSFTKSLYFILSPSLICLLLFSETPIIE
jgi:hypothetical protein